MNKSVIEDIKYTKPLEAITREQPLSYFVRSCEDKIVWKRPLCCELVAAQEREARLRARRLDNIKLFDNKCITELCLKKSIEMVEENYHYNHQKSDAT